MWIKEIIKVQGLFGLQISNCMIRKTDKDLYFVAVKVFITNSKNELLITKDRFGDWDIPGGRLKPDEFNKPLESVVLRKLKKELGSSIKYKLSLINIFMRHERNEILASGKREKRRIFAISYKAKYLSGKITLGKSHLEYKWENISTLNPKKYFEGGWLVGVKEFIKLSRNE
jgi:ADP-ribose pyrophosphatase YjhB (NUDIX family)